MNWSADFFRAHRRALAEKVDGGLVVLTAHRLMQQQADMAYRFSQEADFWYMTGIDQPDWIVVYDGARDYTWLIEPTLSETERLFDGAADVTAIKDLSGANEIVGWGDFEKLLRTLTRKHSTVYTSLPPKGILADRVVENPARHQTEVVLRRIFGTVIDCHKDIAALRAIKSDLEIEAITRAVEITVKAFEKVRSSIDSYQYEYEVEAELGYQFQQARAKHAYEPIVAGAERACTLHYTANQQSLRKGAAVLIDAGAKLDQYCADITRTYIKGKPSRRYHQLHHALQQAHLDIIDLVQPHMPLADYIRQVDDIMKRTLVDVGLLKSHSDEGYRAYFPHAVSHGLGLDVHDSLGGSRTLAPGMVITVEPGIYVPDEKIGIRLEDNILVTVDGHRNLSAKLSTDY